jgi:hypothetical protein
MCGVVKPPRLECGPMHCRCQVRLSAKHIGTRQYARLADEWVTADPTASFSKARQARPCGRRRPITPNE